MNVDCAQWTVPLRSSSELQLAFGDDLAALRVAFEHQLKSLPQVFAQCADKFYKQRIALAGNRPLLGEQIAVFVSEMFDLTPVQARALGSAWLHLYTAILLVDDLADRSGGYRSSVELFLGPLLQQRGTTLLTRLAPVASGDLLSAIEAAFIKTAEAGQSEIVRHRARITEFTAADFTTVHAKMAAANVCTVAAYYMSNRNVQQEQIRAGLERVQTAIQLLDDVTDLEEDLANHDYTYPLTLALGRREGVPAGAALEALLVTGALEDTFEIVAGELAEGIARLSEMECASQMRVVSYLASMRSDVVSLGEEARLLRFLLSNHARSASVARYAQDVDDLAKRIAQYKQRLVVVAQNC